MIVKNKWNGNIYTVKSFDSTAGEVTLTRQDGSEFTIAQKEYKYNYYEVKNGEADNN